MHNITNLKKLINNILQVLGGLDGKSRIYKSTMKQSQHDYVTLYFEKEYETLVLEAHFDVKCPDFPIEN
jgi:hypothetical protein